MPLQHNFVKLRSCEKGYFWCDFGDFGPWVMNSDTHWWFNFLFSGSSLLPVSPLFFSSIYPSFPSCIISTPDTALKHRLYFHLIQLHIQSCRFSSMWNSFNFAKIRQSELTQSSFQDNSLVNIVISWGFHSRIGSRRIFVVFVLNGPLSKYVTVGLRSQLSRRASMPRLDIGRTRRCWPQATSGWLVWHFSPSLEAETKLWKVVAHCYDGSSYLSFSLKPASGLFLRLSPSSCS
jgi:hypothetical protein